MKSFLFSLSLLFLSIVSSAQPKQVPDKVQFQSVRAGLDLNSNYGGLSQGTLTRIYVGYHIDQSKKWGISPFFNISANILQNIKPDTFGVRAGFEPGLLSGYQNDHIGIKLLTSVNLIFSTDFSNGILAAPVLGISVGNGRKPFKDNLVFNGYVAVSPSFQNAPTSFVIGANIGLRLRPITYVREF